MGFKVASRRRSDKLSGRAAGLADAIAEFERECRRTEYTDTDIAWQLLHQARRQLRRLGRRVVDA